MKISFIGCGKVGSTVAFAAGLRGLAREMVMVDFNAEKARGEAWDILQGRAFMPQVDIRSGNMEDTAGSDIAVISAGIPRKADEPRVLLLSRNAALIADIVRQTVGYSPNCILLMITNPLDIMTQLAYQASGLPVSRVIGMGTVLDTSRYRSCIAAEFGCDARDIDAYVIGEHGETMVPLRSNITVKGIPLERLAGVTTAKLDKIVDDVVTASGTVIALKGGTVFAPAAAACAILEAIVHDNRQVLPVCTYQERYGVSLSLPTLVGREGALGSFSPALSAAEEEMLQKSVRNIRAYAEHLSEYLQDSAAAK